MILYIMSYRQDLSTWKKQGLYDRETGMLGDIGCFSDLLAGFSFENFFSQKKEIKIRRLPISYHTGYFSILLSCIRTKNIKIVTNQDSALVFALPLKILFFWKLKLYYRSGYSQLEFFKKRQKDTASLFLIFFLEKMGNMLCDVRVVSNDEDFEKFQNKQKQIFLIPNSEKLHSPEKQKKYLISHVGRQSSQKRNILVRRILSQYAGVLITNREVKATEFEQFIEIPQGKVLEILKQSEFFLFISRYEGSPKALIEAIMCGCIPVLSREVISILPSKLSQYFIEVRISRKGEIVNLDEIKRKYITGQLLVQKYFDRERAIKLWRRALGDI